MLGQCGARTRACVRPARSVPSQLSWAPQSARPRRCAARWVAPRAAAAEPPQRENEPISPLEFKVYIQTDVLDKVNEIKDSVVISDVVSDNGKLQWVDLVLAGGGMLGIALVGFVCTLEHAGIRFRSIGGTSAGAINAMAIAACREDPSKESWEGTLKLLGDAEFSTFQDGKEEMPHVSSLVAEACKPGGLDKLLNTLRKGSAVEKVRVGWALATAISEAGKLWHAEGVHPGDKFQEWVRDKVLGANGVSCTQDLWPKLSKGLADDLALRRDRHDRVEASRIQDVVRGSVEGMLKLVAQEVTTQTMVVFPKMASLFTIQAKPADGDPTVNPADGCPLDRDPSLFVRASMSVPGFFRPCTANINDKGDWAGLAYYKGQLPADKTAVFVDGGTLSNFPLELFDVGDYVPLMPTLGCQLGVQRDDENHVALDVSNPLKLYKAMNETSRHIGDWEYIHKNPAYEPLLATVNTTGFFWLDFDMGREDQKRLFKEGAKAALELLERFNMNPVPKRYAPEGAWRRVQDARAKALKEQGAPGEAMLPAAR